MCQVSTFCLLAHDGGHHATRSLSVMEDGRKQATWAAWAAQMLTCAAWVGACVLLLRCAVQAALLPPDVEDEASDEDSDDDDASVGAPWPWSWAESVIGTAPAWDL